MAVALQNYRLVATDGAWRHHLVDASQRTVAGVTVALQELGSELLAPKTVKAYSNGALRLLDGLAEAGRGIRPDDAPATIQAGVKAYLRSLGLRTRRDANRPWYQVAGPRAALARGKQELAGARRIWTIMVEQNLYPFEHPLELSEEAAREQRRRARASGRKQRAAAAHASLALFRFDPISYRPPRRTQVSLVANAIELAEAAGWWPGRVIYLRIMYDGGPRPSEPTSWTMLDWAEGSRCGTGVRSPSKNSHGERVKDVLMTPETHGMLRVFVDGERRRARPGALTAAEYLRLYDEGEHERLAAEPLLVDADGRALNYDRLARAFRRDVADRVVDPATGRPPMIRPTLHWLRHLFVYHHLHLIKLEKLDAAEERRRKEQLCEYIGWSTGMAMLSTYGKEFERAEVAAEMAAHMLRRTAMSIAVKEGRGSWMPPSTTSFGTDAKIATMFRDRRASSGPAPFSGRPAPRR